MKIFQEPRWAPSIEAGALPESERSAIDEARTHLESLDRYAEDFRVALQLFNITGNQGAAANQRGDRQAARLLSRWHFIAARDAIMTIYHFGKARDGINSAIASSRTLERMFSPKLSEAHVLFNSSFPTYVQMRHAVAHAEDKRNKPWKRKEHDLSGPIDLGGVIFAGGGGTVTMGENLIGQTYTSSWKGEVVSCEISQATAEQMGKVVDAFFDAFNHAASKASEAQPRP